MAATDNRDSRRIRFESIEGLQRSDLGIAGEVWLRDICNAPWVTREAMKLAAHLVRYMASFDPRLAQLTRIEHQTQLTREEISQTLRLMRLYRAIEAYSIEGDDLRAALHLSTLQRLQVLEARHRLEYLMQLSPPELPMNSASSSWRPKVADDDVAPKVA